MRIPITRPHAAIAGLSVALTLMRTAACGSQNLHSGKPASEAKFDQALHDRLPPAVLERGSHPGRNRRFLPAHVSVAPDGRTIIGMEPDLGAAIGRVLGVRVEFVNCDFTTLLADVAGGELDPGCRP